MEKKPYKILRIYNDEQLLKYKKKEITALNDFLKSIPGQFNKKKKITKNPLPGIYTGAVSLNPLINKRINESKKNKDEINQLIKKIENMSLIKYLYHINKIREKEENDEKKDNEEIDEEEMTTDESINTILNLNKIQKEEKNIIYTLSF